MLLLLFTGCSSSAQELEPTYYLDTFHQRIGELSLDLEPPEAWPDTLQAYEIAYCFLDHEKLKETLIPEVTKQLVNLKDEEAGTPDYYLELLTGSDGMSWSIREDSFATSTQAIYDYCNEEPFTMSSDFQLRDVEKIQEAVDTASDFLSSIGLEQVEARSYNKLDDTLYVHFCYAECQGIPMYDARKTSYESPFTSSYFNVAVVGTSVQYADITFPYEIITTEETEQVIAPEVAGKALVEWYTDNAYGESYTLDTLELCWAIASKNISYDAVDTALLRPYWAFYGMHGEEYECVAVDAISGEIVCKTY
jgi:hypothetical protein